MPDHWHGLVELSDTERLSTLVARVKAVSARAIACSANQRVRVWERGFHDRAIRHDDNLLATARYVIRNPLRAGLCKRIADYPFWDASWI